MRFGIKKEPSVKPYAYLAYIDAILENDVVLRAKIVDAHLKEWNTISYDTKLYWEEDYLNIVNVNEQYGNNNTETFVYTDCREYDELEVKMEQFINIREYAIVNLFVCAENDLQDALGMDTNVYRLGVTRYGLYIKHNKELISLAENAAYKEVYDSVRDWNMIQWFKIKVNKNMIHAYISKDNVNWFLVDCMEVGRNVRFKHIGLNANFLGMGKQYYNWLYMNFIQLNLNKYEVSKVYLNYYSMPYLGSVNEQPIAQQFIESKRDSYDEVIDLFHSFKEYVFYCLEHKYYVVISIDEFYVPGVRHYQKQHFYHPLLIYGYDEDNKKFLVMDYDIKPLISQIDEELLDNKEIAKNKYSLMRYKFLSNIHSDYLMLDIKSLVQSFRDYLNGNALDYRFSHMLPRLRGSYGINVLKDLICDERGRYLLCHDMRIAYLLYEHCVLMQKRISFLTTEGHISEEEESCCIEMAARMVEEADVLKNCVIKYGIKEGRGTALSTLAKLETDIVRQVEALYECEYVFYTKIIDILSQKSDC